LDDLFNMERDRHLPRSYLGIMFNGLNHFWSDRKPLPSKLKDQKWMTSLDRKWSKLLGTIVRLGGFMALTMLANAVQSCRPNTLSAVECIFDFGLAKQEVIYCKINNFGMAIRTGSIY